MKVVGIRAELTVGHLSQVEGDTPKTTYLIDRTFGYTYLIK